MKRIWNHRWGRVVTGIAIGALGGYLYWQQIGCISGSCAITSVWWRSTLYGALMSGLLLDSFNPRPKSAH